MDIDAIPVGRDFRDHIQIFIGRCHVVLAVIGPKWNVAAQQWQATAIQPKGLGAS